jgi:hypothetical protein
MDLSTSSLLSGLLISALGGGLFLFGKKSGKIPYVLVGIAMCIYPYFIPSALLLWALTVLLLVPLYTFRHSM